MTAGELAVLTRMPDGLEVSHDGHNGSYIGVCVARRSQLLRNILEDTEEGDTFPVPITVDRLNAWRSFRDNDTTALQFPTPEMIELLLAADVLIDMKCLEAVCYELSQRLFPRPGPPIQSAAAGEDASDDVTSSKPAKQLGRNSTVADAVSHARTGSDCGASETIEALESLPDHLALSVMRAVVHLPALLAALPSRLHPAALRAHHPSIDSHQALHLTFPPPDTLPLITPALAGLTSLTAVTIRMRKHGASPPDSMHPQQFFDAVLGTLPDLADLCMEDWRVTHACGAPVAPPAATQHAAPLTRLALRNASVSMQSVAPRFHALRMLRALEVSMVTQHSDDSRPRGRMLSADACELAAHIGELTALEHLSLEQNHVVPEDWRGLAAGLAVLPRLRSVNFVGLQLVSDVLFAAPTAADNGPGDKRQADAGVPVAVAGVWRQMEAVNVAGNAVCARKPLLWRALGQMPGLKHLVLANVPTQRGVFVHLLQALREGCAERHAADADADGVSGEEGAPASGEVGTSGVLDGARKGHTAFQLESVDVSGCRVVWGDAFEKCMHAWPGLQRLVASGPENVPRTVDARMGAAGQGLTAGRAPYLARGLAAVCGLRELVLSGHKGLGADGVAVLAPALATLTALTLLDLSACDAGPAGGTALCETLPRLTRLEVLRVAGNRIGSDGAGRVLEGLGGCVRVREVDLSRNGVGDGVAVVLKGQLKLLQSLERLDLRGNVLREAKAVLRAVSMRRGNVLVL